MSIYIFGMEMPDKTTTIVIFPEGKARVFRQDIDHDEWLTAIEVPKHGKLVDVDALDIRRREQQAWQDYEHNPDNEYLEGVKDGLHEASKQLSTAMTIIEADSDVMFYPQVDGITSKVSEKEMTYREYLNLDL